MLDIDKLKNQIRNDLRINNQEYDDEIVSLIQTSIMSTLVMFSVQLV